VWIQSCCCEGYRVFDMQTYMFDGGRWVPLQLHPFGAGFQFGLQDHSIGDMQMSKELQTCSVPETDDGVS
jgi:hypothetical protein